MFVLSKLIKDKLMPGCYSVRIIIFKIKTHFLFSEAVVRILKSFDIYYVSHGRVKESAWKSSGEVKDIPLYIGAGAGVGFAMILECTVVDRMYFVGRIW